MTCDSEMEAHGNQFDTKTNWEKNIEMNFYNFFWHAVIKNNQSSVYMFSYITIATEPTSRNN